MKQYIYSPQDLGLSEWPSGTLRLEGIETTTNPDEADLFVCPGPLLLFQDPGDLGRFPFMAGHEEKHVFFDCSDFDTVYTRKNPILFRCNLKRHMLEAHPNSISMAWPVEDFAECVELPEGGFKYDVSFHGWMSTETRIHSATACRKNGALKADVAGYADFTGYLHDRVSGKWTLEGTRRRAEFRRSMRESRVALCPESIPGVFPYRFFEAMSAGRVPLLVASDYNFPFAAEIPYSDFALTCERADAAYADRIVLQFVRTHSDSEIHYMGMMARKYWERWLNSADWPRLMAYAVQQKVAPEARVAG